eukprot:gene7517-8796_t
MRHFTVVHVDKKKKPEEKTLILGINRLFFFNSKGKLEEDYHYLDCIEISSPSVSEVSIKFKNQQTIKLNSQETGEILKTLYSSEVGGCGSFAATYKSVCDYLGIQPLSSVVWDIENLYPFNAIREFNLNEIYQYGPADLKAILISLSYNTYFHAFVANGCKLSNDDLIHLTDAIKVNTTIQRLLLNNTQSSKESLMSFLPAISENKAIKLSHLNIGSNVLENKGLVTLGNSIQSWPNGLGYLNIESTSSGSKGLESLFNSLLVSSSLTTLNFISINNNKLELAGTTALCKFLTKATALTTLQMSNTSPVFGQLRNGCPTLEVLDFSGNRPSSTKEGIVELLGFFKQMPKLQNINLSRVQIGGDDIKILFSPATSLLKVAHVDLSENELGDAGILKLCEVMYPNSNLRHLSIDNNFKTRSKLRHRAIEAICNLIEDNTSIESLSIAGSPSKGQLKGDLITFVISLLKNQSLVKLDISGNAIGDQGILALTKVIWRNQALRSLKFDDNGFTAAGLKMLKTSIKRNPKSLTYLSLPLGDINAVLLADKSATGQDKTHKTLIELQNAIAQNVPNHYAPTDFIPAKPSPVRKQTMGTQAPPPATTAKSPSFTGETMLAIKRPVRGPLYPGRTADNRGPTPSSSGSLSSSDNIPPLVTRSIEFLVAKGTKNVGIFRTCASATLLKKIKARFEAGEDIDLTAEGVDCDTVAGVLKSYFRELPVPIFPENIHDRFFQASREASTDEKIAAYHQVIEQLQPTENKMVKKLFHLLYLVSLERAENMMSAENIAICWAPTLFRSFASELLPINAFLMIHYYEIFDPENAPVKQSNNNKRLSVGAGSDSQSSGEEASPPPSPIMDGTATLRGKRFSRVSRISYSPVLSRAAWGESTRSVSSLFQEDDWETSPTGSPTDSELSTSA